MAAKKDGIPVAELARARDIGVRLSASTDELNAHLVRAEKLIAGLKLGVVAWVDITTDADRVDSATVQLGFQKVGPAWKLYVRVTTSTAFASEEVSTDTALLGANRRYRMQAAPFIPALVTAMVRHAENELRTVSAAVEAVRAVNEELSVGVTSADTGLDKVDDEEIPF